MSSLTSAFPQDQELSRNACLTSISGEPNMPHPYVKGGEYLSRQKLERHPQISRGCEHCKGARVSCVRTWVVKVSSHFPWQKSPWMCPQRTRYQALNLLSGLVIMVLVQLWCCSSQLSAFLSPAWEAKVANSGEGEKKTERNIERVPVPNTMSGLCNTPNIE